LLYLTIKLKTPCLKQIIDLKKLQKTVKLFMWFNLNIFCFGVIFLILIEDKELAEKFRIFLQKLPNEQLFKYKK
jgi:hypothetical protein